MNTYSVKIKEVIAFELTIEAANPQEAEWKAKNSCEVGELSPEDIYNSDLIRRTVKATFLGETENA